MPQNSQKVKQGDVLVSNRTNVGWYVDLVSDNGMMSIFSLDTEESSRVSTTFANSCMIFREID